MEYIYYAFLRIQRTNINILILPCFISPLKSYINKEITTRLVENSHIKLEE